MQATAHGACPAQSAAHQTAGSWGGRAHLSARDRLGRQPPRSAGAGRPGPPGALPRPPRPCTSGARGHCPLTQRRSQGLRVQRAAGSPLGLRVLWPGGWLLAGSLLHGELPELRLELFPALCRRGHGYWRAAAGGGSRVEGCNLGCDDEALRLQFAARHQARRSMDSPLRVLQSRRILLASAARREGASQRQPPLVRERGPVQVMRKTSKPHPLRTALPLFYL